MTRYALLDTSVVISAMGAGEVEELPYDVLVVSALSYAELRLGLVTATDMDELRRRIRRIEAISRVFGPGIPFDDACAREYERVVQAAVDHGQRPRTNAVDRMIAAVAAAHRMPLLTRNAVDLRGVDGLVDIVTV
ncbi:MAG TPA: type II toxin-antitoxin system VapC family toxin [Intrasporangiaceae bacterium]|nr:type II toxin-antitoxin system VapC family toxin [Intrasporangiaceae bacterium]